MLAAGWAHRIEERLCVIVPRVAHHQSLGKDLDIHGHSRLERCRLVQDIQSGPACLMVSTCHLRGIEISQELPSGMGDPCLA